MDIGVEYSKERGTWNVFEGPIWYAEVSTYEEAEEIAQILREVEL